MRDDGGLIRKGPRDGEGHVMTNGALQSVLVGTNTCTQEFIWRINFLTGNFWAKAWAHFIF